MDQERGNGAAKTDRFAGLLSWWGITDPVEAGPFGPGLKRLQGFVSEVQKAYGEAYGRQMEGLFAANEHFAQAVQGLMRSRRPADAMAAQSGLMATLMEDASAQAKGWADLVEKLKDCCSSVARESAEEAGERGEPAAHVVRQRTQHAAARARRHAEAV